MIQYFETSVSFLSCKFYCSFIRSVLFDAFITTQISNSDLAKLTEIPESLSFFRDNLGQDIMFIIYENISLLLLSLSLLLSNSFGTKTAMLFLSLQQHQN